MQKKRERHNIAIVKTKSLLNQIAIGPNREVYTLRYAADVIYYRLFRQILHRIAE